MRCQGIICGKLVPIVHKRTMAQQFAYDCDMVKDENGKFVHLKPMTHTFKDGSTVRVTEYEVIL